MQETCCSVCAGGIHHVEGRKRTQRWQETRAEQKGDGRPSASMVAVPGMMADKLLKAPVENELVRGVNTFHDRAKTERTCVSIALSISES